MLQTHYLLPLMVATLLLAVGALGFRATRRRGYGPSLLGLVAAVLVGVGKFVYELDVLTHGGIALLIVASVWNAWPKRTARADLIELGIRKRGS